MITEASDRHAYLKNVNQRALSFQKPEPVSLGPQPTPEMEAIAREVDALVRERLQLDGELTMKQRELTVKTGECNSLEVYTVFGTKRAQVVNLKFV